MKICLLGFGTVGQGVAKAISLRKKELKEQHGIEIKIVAVSDSTGSAIDNNGLDENLLLEVKNNTSKISNYPEYGNPKLVGIDILDKIEYDCLVELTPTNIEDGEPAKSMVLKAMNDGKHVVTSNKGHLALSFKELIETAKKNDIQFKFESSVGGAMPIINFAQETLTGSKIESIHGILNGTTNYILSRMTSEGTSYENTLEEAQQLGIAETNPVQDVEGIDAACKTVILANSILNINAVYSDVDVTGITNISSEAIELASKEGYLIKLISEVTNNSLKVSPRLVKKNSPYAIDGTLNMATLKTDLADNITVVGKGAGDLETASAILSDIVNIYRYVKK